MTATDRPREADLVAHWQSEERVPFTGWDFSYLTGRMTGGDPPWSFLGRARQVLAGASALLDMGTGGGERLLDLQQSWPARMVATEDYPPNVRLAAERLAPLGAAVVCAPAEDDSPLPFANGSFSVVLNRHSAFNTAEVARVLAPGGCFLTQQIHGRWAEDLLATFGCQPQYPNATPQQYVPRLEAAGLVVRDAREWRGALTFTDVGAIVYYLKTVPWEVPGFSVATHLHGLFRLQERLERDGTLSFRGWMYMIEAYRPA